MDEEKEITTREAGNIVRDVIETAEKRLAVGQDISDPTPVSDEQVKNNEE